MDEAALKKVLQESMHVAMKTYRGPSYVDPPGEAVKYGRYDQMSRFQIDQGVVAFVLHCNSSGGSVEDLDIYKRMNTYRLDKEARIKINQVLST